MYSFKPQKKRNRSYLYKLSAWLHLWLGLLSGIVVFIVSVTGAIYVFKEEILVITESFQTVEVPENAEMLPPSELSQAAKEAFDYPRVWGVGYRGEGKSAVVPYYADRSNYQVGYINPYTGEPLYNRYLEDSFFRFIIIGHYQLWLPRWIGKPIVAYGTLIFVVLLISGLVLWWPKRWSKRNAQKALKIRWNSSWRRLNLDLHNVVGFYSLLIALILALTGMVYGMNWFKEAVYWSATGEALPQQERVVSDTTLAASQSIPDEDRLYNNVTQSGLDFTDTEVWFYYPRGEKGVWTVQLNADPGTTYLNRKTYYEQHSLKKLKQEPAFAEANLGEQLMRLNYDLHVGSIGGMWTKIIAFLVCIVCASLPVTGFIFWYDRERRKSKRNKQKRNNGNRGNNKKTEQPKRITKDPVSV